MKSLSAVMVVQSNHTTQPKRQEASLAEREPENAVIVRVQTQGLPMQRNGCLRTAMR